MLRVGKAEAADGGASARGAAVARRLRPALVRGFMVFGIVLTALLVAGTAADGLGFDRTRGGYEPTYTDYTGEPIDWEREAYVTQEGFFKDGYVIDLYVNCRTGMIGFDVFEQRWDWREFSGRALAVHKPREACERAGFDPEF